MNARAWPEVRAHFDELVALEPSDRAGRLTAIAAADPAMHRVLSDLLAADEMAGQRLAHIERRLGVGSASSDLPALHPDPLGLTGQTISHYRVRELIDAGGMGVVYRAEDDRLDRVVALKFLLPQYAIDTDAKERFLREARSAGRLDHANLCTIYDVGEAADGRLFYAMPLYAGETLKSRLARDGALAVEEATTIAGQIASGLACAHAAGIVHRDLKPGNVMLLPDRTVKILDFGLSRAADGSSTATRERLGTVAYMAPEQIEGSPGTERSDLWALGVVLYEMLTGARPFGGRHAYAVAHSIVNEQPVVPSSVLSDIPAAVSDMVLWLLQKDPGNRCQTASEFLDALPVAHSEVLPGRARLQNAPHARSRTPLRVSALRAIAAGAVVLLVKEGPDVRRMACDGSAERSIAVLPFVNRSANPEATAHLAGALHDDVITQLARIEALEVRGRQSTLSYSGSDRTSREIGEELGVCRILRGSIQRLGDRVRINVQLVDAATDEHDWAQRFDRDLTDVFTVQNEIAREIVAALQLQLTPAEREHLDGSPRRNAKAYDFYLQAREYQLRGDHLESQRAAENLFRRAVEFDSSFALAHARLAITHGWFSFFGFDPTARRIEQMRLAAETALRLQPDLPEAHLGMGYYWYGGVGDYSQALREFEITRQGSPDDAEMHAAIAYVHRRQGRWEEAVAGLERAVELDPRYPKIMKDLAVAYMQLRRYSHAVRVWDRVIDLEPDNYEALLLRGEIFVAWQGTTDSLAAASRRIPPTWDPYGRRTLAMAALARLRQRPADVLLSLDMMRPDVIDVRDYVRIARVLTLRAEAHQALGDTARAREEFIAAKETLEMGAVDWINDPRINADLAVIHARLGEKELALRHASLARDEAVKDAAEGPRRLVSAAESYAWVSETEAAIELLGQILRRPGFLSVHHLRLETRWDPLRSDPRFQRLLSGPFG